MWGGGRVTIDRSDFAAQGDSMQLDQPTGFGVLVGKPAMEGKGARPYKLTGTRIELGLAGRELRRVKALGEGVATGSDWRLTADTIDLRLERRKLQRAQDQAPRAHFAKQRPRAYARPERARHGRSVDQLFSWHGHPRRPEAGQGRHRDGDRTRRRRPARAPAAGARYHEASDSDPSQPMTAPISPHRVADLMAARDSSLPLAAAALARVADGRGGASLGELAIAYREEFLKLRARSRGAGGGLPELGALSVEQFRATLRSSVLPRLA